MNANDFTDLLDGTFDKVRTVLNGKAAEYADDIDRLRNFKQAAKLQDESPIEALSGMMAKHTISVYDLMREQPTLVLDVWDEKIIDHINYLILLRALVTEAAIEKNTEKGMHP
jgi:hypothetical protein